MKMSWRDGGVALCILNLSNRSERSISCLGRFAAEIRAPDTHWIGGWVEPRAGLDAVAKR
jgi:hypothetical protein